RVAGAHEDSGATAGQARRCVTGILDCRPGMHHQQPLLRIHQHRLSRRDAEKARIEAIDILEESAPLHVRGVRLLMWIAPQRAPVPARKWNLRDGIEPGGEVLPEALQVGGAWEA